MQTTDKLSCRIIARLLVEHGVEDVVISPGSRNAPLIIAVSRQKNLRCHVVIDERSAAFFALGIALQTGKAVALVCTSGSAVLNYGPALAEAFYRHVPLIAISADRPEEWIDQDDSQTIHQTAVLDNIVKASFEIGVETDSKVNAIYISRKINDALILAMRSPRGPVHINVRLDEPLGRLADDSDDDVRVIEAVGDAPCQLSDYECQALARKISSSRTLVIAGFASPDRELDGAIASFVRQTGAVVMHEAQSNIHLSPSVSHIDATLSVMNKDELARLAPQLVITFGGSIVSRMVKRYLREAEGVEHWHIGRNPNSIDCFMKLTHRIECEPRDFFNHMALEIDYNDNREFLKSWIAKAAEARQRVTSFYAACPWSDFYAIGRMINFTPRSWNIQLSNGTSVRYAQLFEYSALNRIECNRGVSGIDGSISTAIGAHIYYDDVTMLITGDMSMAYDVGALALTEITPRFKIAVLNNGGGGIFRFISSTSSLEECERFFAADVSLPLAQLAEAYGFAYFEARDKESFDRALVGFASETERPALLNIITPPQESAVVLKQFFNLQ